MLTEHVFAHLDDAAQAVSEATAEALGSALALRTSASLIVSGGRTSEILFPRLARTPLAWNRVWITLSDERWLPPADAESNEGLVRRLLLRERAKAAPFVGLWRAVAAPGDAVAAVAAALAPLPRPFDAVYLGLGEDGHIASLFPHGAALEDRASPCAAAEAPSPPRQRMTLTPPVILDARVLFLLFSGPAKRKVYEQAKAAGPVALLPLRLVLRQSRVPVVAFIAEHD